MDCATGILIDLVDFDKPQDSVKQELKKAVPNDVSESSVLEMCDGIILREQLCSVNERINHPSPVCGVLIDIDSPFDGSKSVEALVRPRVEINIQDCNGTRHSEQNNCDLTSHEKSRFKSSKFSKNGSSSGSSGSSRSSVNFSWSPSVIYNDVDLLENEKFDFNLSTSSTSPYRGNDEVFLMDESICKKCCCKKEKPPKLSTPQRGQSLLNAAFIAEISEGASKVLTHLSAKKIPPPQKSASDIDQFSCLSLNLGPSLSQHNDSGVEEQDCNFDNSEIVKETSFRDKANDSDLFVSGNKASNLMEEMEFFKKKSFSPLEGAQKFGTEVNTRTTVLENKIIDDCIILNLNAIQLDGNISDKVTSNISNTENKENIPLNPIKSETSVLADSSNITEISDSMVNSGDLIPEKPPSPAKKGKILSISSSNELSPLVRRETFTVKPSPLQSPSGSTAKRKTTNISGERNDGDLKAVKRKSVCTPRIADTKAEQSTSLNSLRVSSTSRKSDAPNSRTSLIRKETYTVSPVSRKKVTPAPRNATTPLVSEICNTPNKVTGMSSVAGKAKSLSCKVATKSRYDSPPAASSSKPKSPKETVASSFRTPTMPKRSSILPSRLSYSQSHAAPGVETKAGTSTPQSSSKVLRTNSFQLPKGPGLSSRPPPPMLGTKPRASSAGEIADVHLFKKTLPVKAVAPLNNMVKKGAVTSSSGTNGVSNTGGSKGQTSASSARRGLVPGRISAVVRSEQVKRSNSLSTPKAVSTPSKPRFLSQSDTPSTPVSLRKDPGIRRLSFVPTPKRFTPKQCSEKL